MEIARKMWDNMDQYGTIHPLLFRGVMTVYCDPHFLAKKTCTCQMLRKWIRSDWKVGKHTTAI